MGGIAFASTGGKKKENVQQPPTGAKDQDEEKFIQYVTQRSHLAPDYGYNGANATYREFIKQAEQEGEKASQKQGQGH